MRNPLAKRLKRDLKDNAGRYMAISIILILTISIVASFLVVADSVKYSYENNQIDCFLEDGQFKVNSPISEETIHNAERLGLSLYQNNYIDAAVLANTKLRVYENRSEINLVTVMEGDLPNAFDEIAVDRLYAASNKLNVDDVIELFGRKVKITGLVSLPDYSSLFENNSDLLMDSFHFGVAVVTEEAFESLSKDKITYNYSYYINDRNLSEKEKVDLGNKTKLILIESGAQLTGFLTAADNQSISFVKTDMGSDVPMMKVLLCILIIIMAFVFNIIIRSTIEEESAIIGTLLASGYNRYEITGHYISMPVIITLISAILGNLLAYTLMLAPFKAIYYKSYSLPPCELRFNLEALILTTVLPIVLMVVINFFTLNHKLSITPIKLLRKQLKNKNNKKAIKLPDFTFINRFRLRVMIQNKGNYFMLFIGIFLASFLLLFGLCMEPLIKHHMKEIEEATVSNYQYILKAPIEAENDEAAEKFTISTLNSYTTLGNKDIEVTIYGLQEFSTFFQDITLPVDVEGAYFSKGLLKKLGAKIGEIIIFTNPYSNKEYSIEIVGVYDYPIGMTAFMSQKQLNQMLDLQTDYFNGYLSDNTLEIEEGYLATVITPEDMESLGEQALSSFEGMLPILASIAIIIYLVLIYILTKLVIDKNALYISYMKMFGYEPSEIRMLYFRSTTFTIIASLLLSIPLLDFTIKKAIEAAFMKSSGYIEAYIPPYLYVIMVLVGILSYLVINFFHVERVNKIDMVYALKGSE